MGRFVSATGQFLMATHGQFSCPPTGSFSCPLTGSAPLEAAGATFVQICPGEDGWPVDLFRNINAPGDL